METKTFACKWQTSCVFFPAVIFSSNLLFQGAAEKDGGPGKRRDAAGAPCSGLSSVRGQSAERMWWQTDGWQRWVFNWQPQQGCAARSPDDGRPKSKWRTPTAAPLKLCGVCVCVCVPWLRLIVSDDWQDIACLWRCSGWRVLQFNSFIATFPLWLSCVWLLGLVAAVACFLCWCFYLRCNINIRVTCCLTCVWINYRPKTSSICS